MMTATAQPQPCHLSGVWLGVAKSLLDDTFGVKCEFWIPGKRWSLLTDNYEIEEVAPADFLPGGVTERSLHEVCDSGEPSVLDISMGQQFVFVPVRQRRRTMLVAAAVVPSHDSYLVLRLARRFVREFELRQELQQLKSENEHFIRQVTQDFEELTFLRSVAQQMEISSVACDIVQVARLVLPPLQHATRAECITMILATPDGQVPDDMAVCAGDLPISSEACLRLLGQSRESARVRPIVRNRRFGHAGMEGLNSFMLASIAKSDTLYGWLLVMNRISGADLQEVDWSFIDDEFSSSEASVVGSAAAMLATHATNLELFREKEQLLTNVVQALVSAIEAKDEYTCGHSERVALYAARLGKELGYDEEACERLYLTGLLHDVGKIGIPDATLGKPARLTDEEFEGVKEHPDESWAILSDLEQLAYVLPGVLYHHESFDGTGYPDRLSGKDIPLDGRILAVADAYDAMTSDRPYRKGMPQEKAEAILLSGTGAQWDPDVVEAFLQARDDVATIRDGYRHQPRRIRQAGTTERQG